MPKRFGHTVCSLATIMMAFSFVGCRTTTSKLASVPGFAWLERDDEGWAQYEPAPGLPRPSSTSEPTGVGTSTSNIADNARPDVKGFGSASGKSDPTSLASKSGPRFDSSRSASNSGFGNSKPIDLSKNAASTYGDYATAYGKYGPPKSIPTNPNSKVAQSKVGPQKGLYDAGTPSYGSSSNSGSTGGYDGLAGKFGTPAGSQASHEKTEPKSNFGYANNRFDNSAPTASPTSSESADSSSRFGVGSYASSNTPKAETYSPPGFVKSSTPPATTAASTSRFGGLVNQVSQGSQAATNYANAAADQVATVAKDGVLNSQQAFNRFANPSSNPTVGGPSSDSANSQLENAAKSVAGQTNGLTASAKSQRNSLSDSARSKFGGVQETLAAPAGKVASFAKGAANRFGGQNSVQGNVQQFQPQATGLAEDAANAKNAFAQAATSAYGQATSTIGEYANPTATPARQGANPGQGVVNNQYFADATKAAQGYLNNAGENLGQSREPIHGVASTAGIGGRNPMQNVSAPMQPTYPSTSTPSPFVVPGGSVTGGNNRSATPPAAAPAISEPARSPSTRSPAAFRPGSTSSFQGATTTRKPLVELATHASSRATDDQLVLAVGDKYQFPKMYR